MSDIKKAYAASVNQTVTNLGGIVSSATWVAGWASGLIDNSSNKYLDYRVTAKIRVASSGLSAGEIRMYLVAMLDDSTWPDVFTGTEGTKTVTSTQIRDAICRIGAISQTDTTNSRDYYLECPSVKDAFAGNMPEKFLIFIAQSTAQNLAAAGNQQVTIKGSYETVL